MSTQVIGQYQGVFTVLVFKVVINPFLLHQPTDKVKIGLPVLHAVFPSAVAASKRAAKIGKAVIAEDSLDNVRRGFVLENAAVRGAG